MTKYQHNKEVREGYPYGSADELPTMIEPDLMHNEGYPAKYAAM